MTVCPKKFSFGRILRTRLLPLVVLVSCACRDEVDNYPAEPIISLSGISFSEGSWTEPRQYDSLIISLSFTDGDNDFGFEPGNEAHVLPPYQSSFFFLKTTGQPVTSDKLFNNEVALEELIRYNDRAAPPYDTLPEFKVGCYYTDPPATYGDPLYWKRNQDHYNIFVEFFYEEAGAFVEFDFEKELCANYNGRVPNEAGENGPFILKRANAKRGELTYRITSLGFMLLFGDKKMKLRIYIKDLALHTSNVIETSPFFLSDI